jgi:hypothetical protein
MGTAKEGFLKDISLRKDEYAWASRRGDQSAFRSMFEGRGLGLWSRHERQSILLEFAVKNARFRAY